MKVLLIFNNKSLTGVRILVNVKNKVLKEKLLSLLEADKDREAFNLLVKEAEPESYIPAGEELSIKPAVTLNEALLD